MKILKKKLNLLTALVISIAVINAVPVHANPEINLIVNYIEITGTKPIIKDESTLVPIRVISETLGATVDWDQKTKQIKISDSSTTVHMTIGNPLVKINDQSQTISTPPIIHKGSTMLPIRFVGEALNAQVHWDASTRTVTVLGEDMTQLPSPDFSHDQWGRKVRTTDLPKNANIFPYITHGVPNWAYEKINMTAPSLTSGSGIQDFPKDFFYSDYDYSRAIKVLESHFNTVLNIDYRTIDREQFKLYVRETFNDKSFAGTGFSNMEWADAFLDHIVDNKIITKGTASVLPEMFWQNNSSTQVASAWVKLEVVAQGSASGGNFQDFGSFPVGQSLAGKIPYLKTGKEYQGLVQFKLIDYQIDYHTNSIGSQIHPEANGFGGAHTAK